MKYNIQLHTGAFSHSNITPDEAVRQLKRVLGRIPVDTVIWGWSSEKELNKAVSETLRENGCGSFVWLPVFSETAEDMKSDLYIPLIRQEKQGIELSSDEHFEFVCPASGSNMDNALKMAEVISKDHYVTGIFLDRIRYPSAANSAAMFMGCMCEHCRAVYRKYGVEVGQLKEVFLQEKAGGRFIPYAAADCRYKFETPVIDGLFKARRAIINNAVRYLSDRIHAMGLRVGIDSFAPVLADFVGQDLLCIAEHVDLIKPMFYSRTTAPAGIPFEIEATARCFGVGKAAFESLWGCSLDEPSAIAHQLAPLKAKNDILSPGIEANSIQGICSASPDYVLRSRQEIERSGIETMTLSWNIALIPDELFDLLS